jgi:nucleotide-binding universal stress UspA family protein
MKTIIVLTDFSINADYVAHYALEMAQHISANLLVCNVFKAREGEDTSGAGSWPLRVSEENSVNDLGELTARLKSRLDQAVPGNGFRPDIAQCSEEGAVDGKLNDLALKQEILMAVISTHSANNLSGDFRKNHAWAIIDQASVPVLVIPYQVRFKPFGAIAFASAMNYMDITILQSLTGLAGYSGAELLVAHMAAESSNDRQEETELKQFFTQIPGKIDYPHIQYRNIKGKNVARSLRELTAHIDIDLLVLVHRRRSALQQLISGSVTRKMLTRPYKPLLIFPCSTVKRSLTVF